MGSRVRIRLFHILHFVSDLLFPLLKNSKSGVHDRGHRFGSGSPVTIYPPAAAVRGGPPPIIFERLKLPQQIIYRRKENLSESPNHQKYWKNILISRFYDQYSRSSRNLGHF